LIGTCRRRGAVCVHRRRRLDVLAGAAVRQRPVEQLPRCDRFEAASLGLDARVALATADDYLGVDRFEAASRGLDARAALATADDYLGVDRFEAASLGLDARAALATADERFDCPRAAFTAAAPTETCVEPYTR
jgi:hypothetical protein